MFFLVPTLIVLKISLSQTVIAQPPYTPVLDLAAGWQGLREFIAGLSLDNYRALGSDWLYAASYLRSLAIAAAVDAHPAADRLSDRLRHRAPAATAQPVLVMAVFLPFLTAFLIRIYAWINILQREGLLNDVLIALGIIHEPVVWLATDTAIVIGIVYSYLPFMVLPLYASLEKMDEALLEAAADLGCPALEGVLADHRAAVGAGDPRRRAAVLHPDRRRVRHPRSARRLECADDRPDACGPSSSRTATGRWLRPSPSRCC